MQFWLNFIVARYSVIGNKYVSLHSDKKYRRMMDKSKLEDFVKKTEYVGDPMHKGFRHTVWFKVLCGLLVILLLAIIYHVAFSTDDSSSLNDQDKLDKVRREAELDTVDIVGDYLFPKSKAKKEDVVSETDERAAKDEASEGIKDADDLGTETENAQHSSGASASDAGNTENSDLSSDPNPLPSSSSAKLPKPKVEKMEAPKATPLESSK